MRLPLLPEETAVIQAACNVANLRRITWPSQVEEPFRRINEGRGKLLQRTRTSDIAQYRELLKRLRGWLERIIGSARLPRDRAGVAADVAPLLRDAFHVQAVLKGGQLQYAYWFNNVEGGCVWALALLLGRHPAITNRLQQCGWSKCLRFSFDPDPERRPRRFCNETHAKRFDNEDSAERQRRYRRKLLARRGRM